MYTRVSSKDQEREGFSIPAQQRLLSAYAERNDIAVVAEFVDVETAKQSGREQFGEMLKYLKQRPTCKAILVEKTDRLYRNIKDYVTLEDLGYELHFVKEGGVMTPDSRSSDKFMHGIRVMVAKNYVDVLSEEARKGMLEKARQGIWPARAPYGYRNVIRSDGKKVVEVDPQLGPRIRQLFEEYATGQFSLKVVAKRARNNGLCYPNSGQPLAASTIHQILQNPFYMGEYDWHGVRYKGIHPALVTPELFAKIQDIMAGRATNCRHEQKRDFAFSGQVYCGLCWDEDHKRMLIGSLIKQKYIYYHCERCKELSRNKYIRERDLDAGFEEAIGRLKVTPATLDLIKRALLAAHAMVRRDRDERVAALQADYDKLTKKIDQAYEDRLEGRIDIEFFDRKAREWREQQARIRRDLANVESADEGALRVGLELFEGLRDLPDRYAASEAGDKRSLVARTTSNSIWRGDHLEVTLRKGYQLLENLPQDPEKANAPGEVPEGVSGRWLQALGRTGNQCRSIESWSVDTRLPHHPAFGIQCEPPPVEVLERSASTDLRAPDEEPATLGDAWSPRLQAIRNRLAQARGWKRWLAEDPERRPVDIARHEGLSRARVSQMMRLLDLAPEVVWDLERPDRAGPVPSEKQLREVAMLADPFEQVRQYRAMLANAPAEQPVAEEPEAAAPAVQVLNVAPLEVDAPPVAPVHVRGFQHLFERARRYHEMMDGESVRSVVEVARLEGVSPSRVSQLLYLLQLAPPIVAVLDVPEALCPPVTHKEILGIARMKSKSQQIKAFWGLVSAASAWGEGMAAK